MHVRTESHTRGHVFVVMLAYLLRWALSHAWTAFNVTVEGGLDHLKTLCAMDLPVNGGGACLRIPRPREQSVQLFQALVIRLPEALPNPQGRVVTRKKLSERRKNRIIRNSGYKEYEVQCTVVSLTVDIVWNSPKRFLN